MSNTIPVLHSPVSLKSLAAASLTKSNKKIASTLCNKEIAECLANMNVHTEEFTNPKGEDKRLIVIDKNREIVEEDLDDSPKDPTSFSDEPTAPGLFHRMTSLFKINNNNENTPMSSVKAEGDNENDNLRDFTSLPKRDEKYVLDIVNLSLRDKTAKLDLKTLSRLLRLAAKDNHNNLLRSVLDEMLVKGFPIDRIPPGDVESDGEPFFLDEISALDYAILNRNSEAVESLLNAGVKSNGVGFVELKTLLLPLIKNNKGVLNRLCSFIKKPLEKSYKENKEKIKEAFELHKESIIRANEESFKSSGLSIDEVVEAIEKDIQKGTLHLDLLVEVAPLFLEKVIDKLPLPREAKIPMSSFMLAVLVGDVEIAQKLADKKANITSCLIGGLPFPTPIFLASLLGSLPMAEMLIKNHVDVDSKGPFEITPLMSATLTGNADLVESLLNLGASVDSQMVIEGDGLVLCTCNAMTIAQAFGNQKIIKLLESKGAKIEDAFSDNTAKVLALFISAVLGNEDNFDRLLRSGIDINTEGYKGLNVFFLMSAVSSSLYSGLGSVFPIEESKMQELIIPMLNDRISYVLNESKELSSKEIKQIVSSLIILGIPTSKNDSQKILTDFLNNKMQFLLDKKANPAIRNAITGSSLVLAAEMRGSLQVKILLDKGDDPNIADNVLGLTPLMIVAINLDFDSLEMLLASDRIDLNLCDSDGNTAIMHMIKTGENLDVNQDAFSLTEIEQVESFKQKREKYIKIIRTLLENGADPNIANNKGEEPLMEAARKGDNEVVEMLLENGADPDHVNQDGCNSLAIAINEKISSRHFPELADSNNYKDFIPTIELLAKNTKNFDLVNSLTGKSLQERLFPENYEIVEILLNSGMNPNLLINDELTPLMIAAAKGDLMMVMLLLKHKADPNIKNRQGHSALSIARQNGNTDIVKTLLNGGANNYRALSIILSKNNNFILSHKKLVEEVIGGIYVILLATIFNSLNHFINDDK